MTKYVIGNWKLNPATLAQATALASSLTKITTQTVRLGCTPAFLHWTAVKDVLKDTNIWVGAQDLTHKTDRLGAFTGDISAAQLADVSADFVIIGHSERRQYYDEDEQRLTIKLNHAKSADLTVVFCIGETKDQYKAGQTFEVLTKQLSALQGISFANRLIIAYEPVWAIGTGLTPTLIEIERAHRHIRQALSMLAIDAPIIYGGSVNDKNARQLASSGVIDGALVGGASLNAQSFALIAQAFDE